MSNLLTASGHAARRGVTLSPSHDMTREGKMRDRATLETARGLLADAYECGVGTPQADKKVQKAVDLLGKTSPALEQQEVGILLGVDSTTVSKYRTRSKLGGPMNRHPFPLADNDPARFAIWMVARVPELFEWMANRPGRGAGGGRPWHTEEQPKPELLEGLPKDWWTTRDVATYMEAEGQKVGLDRLRRLLAAEEMPEPDRMIGSEKVWKPPTIRRWVASRPSR